MYDSGVSTVDSPVVRRVDARDLFSYMCNVISECGVPYVLFKDTINARSNHQHLGTIRSSNLCSEITEYYRAESEIASCNLTTVCVCKYVVSGGDDSNGDESTPAWVDYDLMAHNAGQACHNLNILIDNNCYNDTMACFVRDWRHPLNDDGTLAENQVRYSNMNHRPIGIGMQGFYDALCLLNVPYNSDEAVSIAGQMMEAIYFGACRESCRMAEKRGSPYASYVGSPLERGLLQFDMVPGFDRSTDLHHDRFEWFTLFKDIRAHGMINSMLTAQPPTCSTSRVHGNVEAVEPIGSHRETRRGNAGTFHTLNRNLVRCLEKNGLWDAEMSDLLERHRGSVRDNERIPIEIRRWFPTAYEIPHRRVTDIAVARMPFIDQSDSLNCHSAVDERATFIAKVLSGAHRRGLKTGLYYFRGIAATESSSFGKMVKPSALLASNVCKRRAVATSGECEMCSS